VATAEELGKHPTNHPTVLRKGTTNHALDSITQQAELISIVTLFGISVPLVVWMQPSRLQRQRRRANAGRDAMRETRDRHLERLVRTAITRQSVCQNNSPKEFETLQLTREKSR